MPTPRQIRARIRTAKNIQQITKAMKLVAATRLRRAQESVAAARPYSEKIRDVMQSLGASVEGGVNHPLLRQSSGEPRAIGVILVTGDRGLCGAYNSAIIRKAWELVQPYGPQRVKMICAGKKGAAFFRRRGYDVVEEHAVPNTGLSFSEAQALAHTARGMFEGEEVDALHVAYTQFVTAMTQRPTVQQVLPVAAPTGAPTDAPVSDFIFEPDPAEILGSLLPRYVDTQVFQAIVESVASELGARMTSMSSATDNAGKMISTLTLQLNRARQATITKEIAEIVGGAEALS